MESSYTSLEFVFKIYKYTNTSIIFFIVSGDRSKGDRQNFLDNRPIPEDQIMYVEYQHRHSSALKSFKCLCMFLCFCVQKTAMK